MAAAAADRARARPPRRALTKTPKARADSNPAPVATHAPPPPPPPSKDPREQAVLDRLRALDADGLTPRDALAMVAALAEEVRALHAG